MSSCHAPVAMAVD
jgi:hypothetical protein